MVNKELPTRCVISNLCYILLTIHLALTRRAGPEWAWMTVNPALETETSSMPPPIDCWLEKVISMYEGQEDCTEVLNSSPSASEVTNR